jgi:hypothetical protein
MRIRRCAEDSATFEPEVLKALGSAFDQICEALRLCPDEAHNREVIAVRIIELARNGVIDAEALRDRVLLESRSAA